MLAVFAAAGCNRAEALPTSATDGSAPSGAECQLPEGSCSAFGERRPGRLSEHAAAYDNEHAELLVFGGTGAIAEACGFPPSDYESATWIYSEACSGWRRLTGGPGPRGRHAAAFGQGRFWVYGGRFRISGATSGPFQIYDELWALDPQSDRWQQVPPEGQSPRARTDTALVWDENSERLWLYGGNGSSDASTYIPLGDVWSFDPASQAWTTLSTSGRAPAARLQHAMLFDSRRDRLVIYGGSDESAFGNAAVYSRELWALDVQTQTWSNLDDGTGDGPGGRFWVSLAYDTDRDLYVLFGGHDDTQLGNRNDTWVFDPETKAWKEAISGDTFNSPITEFCSPPYDFALVDTNLPERRSNHVLVWSARCSRTLLFGGKTDCGSTDDLWTFDGNRWSNPLPATQGEVCWRADGDPSACLGLCL